CQEASRAGVAAWPARRGGAAPAGGPGAPPRAPSAPGPPPGRPPPDGGAGPPPPPRGAGRRPPRPWGGRRPTWGSPPARPPPPERAMSVAVIALVSDPRCHRSARVIGVGSPRLRTPTAPTAIVASPEKTAPASDGRSYFARTGSSALSAAAGAAGALSAHE